MTYREKKDISYKKKLNRLFQVDDSIYYLYTSYEDPISGKISDNDRKEIIHNSSKTGQELAEYIIKEYSTQSVNDLIIENDIKLLIEEPSSTQGYIQFGTYDSNGTITLYKGNVKKCAQMLASEKITCLNGDKICEVVLAHELFHYFEDQIPEMYTNIIKVDLWSIGFYTHKSSLISSSEIAAIAFSKQLLKLDFNPCALNYVLSSAINRELAEKYYRKIIELDSLIST